MKKLIAAILAIIFITTSTGATVYLHYCMGKLADWNLGYNTSDTCGKCGMKISEKKNNNGCCKDDHKFLKNTADQKIAELGFQLTQVMVVALPASSIEISFYDFPSMAEVKHVSHAPPRSSCVAVYLRNCVFLI
jgi:hypothetical protein